MAVISTDLKFYKSAFSATDANNTAGGVIESLGGAITATELVSGGLHDLFDAVPSVEASAGRTEYRCIYATNENSTPQTLYDARVFINTNTASANSRIYLALDDAAVGADSSITLNDEIDSTNALSGLTFSLAQDFANGLVVGDIPGNGGKKAIWIMREIDAGAIAAQESSTVEVRGDTDA